jgi:hypothetical protein
MSNISRYLYSADKPFLATVSPPSRFVVKAGGLHFEDATTASNRLRSPHTLRRDHLASYEVPISSQPNHREPVGTLGPMFSTLIQSLPRLARTSLSSPVRIRT